MRDWAKRIETLLTEQSSQGKNEFGIAKACGIAANSVSQWFGRVKGKNPTDMIRADYALAVANYLGTTVEWILTGKGARVASQGMELDKDRLAQAFVATEKAVRGVGLRYDAAQVPDLLVYAYRKRGDLEPGTNKGVLDAFDLFVSEELAREMGRGEETSRSADKERGEQAAQAATAVKKTRSGNG